MRINGLKVRRVEASGDAGREHLNIHLETDPPADASGKEAELRPGPGGAGDRRYVVIDIRIPIEQVPDGADLVALSKKVLDLSPDNS